MLFTFLAERYERRSVMITSNLVFSQWDRIFKDPMTTAAAIDRVVHHSVILELTGPTWRGDEAKQRVEEAARAAAQEPTTAPPRSRPPRTTPSPQLRPPRTNTPRARKARRRGGLGAPGRDPSARATTSAGGGHRPPAQEQHAEPRRRSAVVSTADPAHRALVEEGAADPSAAGRSTPGRAAPGRGGWLHQHIGEVRLTPLGECN